MIGTSLIERLVRRRDTGLLLRHLLELALLITVTTLGEELLQVRQNERMDERVRCLQTEIQIYGANESLDSIRECRIFVPTITRLFSTTEEKKISELELTRDLTQVIALDKGRTPTRQFSFRTVCELVEILRRHELEHRIPEELESLIVPSLRSLVNGRAMCERLIQQILIPETHADFLLETGEGGGVRHRSKAIVLYCHSVRTHQTCVIACEP